MTRALKCVSSHRTSLPSRLWCDTSHSGGYLLGLLHGETEGLDWSELDAKELVLRLLSGLLREHTLSMDTVVFLHASHTHSSLHLKHAGKYY